MTRRRPIALAVLLLALLAWAPAALGFPTVLPGQVKQLANSSLQDPGLNPANPQAMFRDSNGHYLNFTLGGNDNAVWAFSGLAYDTTRGKILSVANGGHADYSGNEVYEWDIGTTQTWAMVRGPSFTSAGQRLIPIKDSESSLDYYTDTSGWYGPPGALIPASRHSYQGAVYMESVGKVWLAGGSRWWDGSVVDQVWWYDPVAHTFELQTESITGGLGISAAWDPHLRRVVYHTHDHLFSYDPAKPDGQRVAAISGDEGDWTSSSMAFWDWKRRRFVMAGPRTGADGNGNGFTYYDLLTNPYAASRVDVAVTGGMPVFQIGVIEAPPCLYDMVRDIYVCWFGGNSLWSVNPDTWVSTEIVFTGDTAPVGTPLALWGRFIYDVQDDLYLTFNERNQNVWAWRHPDQSNVFAAPNKSFALNHLWTFGNGPKGTFSGLPNTAKLNRWILDRARKEIVWTAGDLTYYYPTNTGPNGGQVNGSSGTNEMWRGSFASATPSWTQIVTQFGPVTTDVLPGQPINALFTYDPVNNQYVMMPGFYRDGSPGQLTAGLSAGDGPGALVHLIAAGLSNSSSGTWPTPTYLYVIESGVTNGGQQEIIQVTNKVVDIDDLNGTYEIVARRAQGTTGGLTWPIGSKVYAITQNFYGANNPNGPVGDYGAYVMNPTVQSDGWAHWARAAFAPPSGGYGSEAGAIGAFDTLPVSLGGTGTMFRFIGSNVMQALNRSSVPGTWTSYSVGGFDAEVGHLASAISSGGTPGPGGTISISEDISDARVWPSDTVLIVGDVQDGASLLEWITVTNKNTSAHTYEVVERGTGAMYLQTSTDGFHYPDVFGPTPAVAHASGVKVQSITSAIGTPGAPGHSSHSVDERGRVIYIPLFLGGAFGVAYGPVGSDPGDPTQFPSNLPFRSIIMKFNMDTHASSFVTFMPRTFTAGAGYDCFPCTFTSIGEQYTFFDPLNRVLIVPNNVAAYGGPTVGWFVYHVDNPKGIYNLADDPGWESVALPGGQLSSGTNGIHDEFRNLTGWFPYSGTDIYTTFRYYGGPTIAAPAASPPTGVSGKGSLGGKAVLQ